MSLSGVSPSEIMTAACTFCVEVSQIKSLPLIVYFLSILQNFPAGDTWYVCSPWHESMTSYCFSLE